MYIVAYFGIPKSDSKAKSAEKRANRTRPTKRPDIDNVIKTICDGLNGVAYYDDSQVVEVTAEKRYSDEPRVEVSIEIVENSIQNKVSTEVLTTE